MLVSSHVHLSNYLSNCLPRSPLTLSVSFALRLSVPLHICPICVWFRQQLVYLQRIRKSSPPTSECRCHNNNISKHTHCNTLYHSTVGLGGGWVNSFGCCLAVTFLYN